VEGLMAQAGCTEAYCPGNLGVEGRCFEDAILAELVGPGNVVAEAERCEKGKTGCPFADLCLERNKENIARARAEVEAAGKRQEEEIRKGTRRRKKR